MTLQLSASSTHPEFVAMTNRVVAVLDEQSFSRTIEPLLIASLEPLSGAKPDGNGARKNKPKS
jgi:hypothetical protein